MPEKRKPKKIGLRQLHLWLERADYAFVKSLARERDESVSRLFRRLIAAWRTRATLHSGTKAVPTFADQARIGKAVDTPKGAGGNAITIAGGAPLKR